MNSNEKYALKVDPKNKTTYVATIKLTREVLELIKNNEISSKLFIKMGSLDGNDSVFKINDQDFELKSFGETSCNQCYSLRKDENDQKGYSFYEVGNVKRKLHVQRLLDDKEKDRIKTRQIDTQTLQKSRTSKLIDAQPNLKRRLNSLIVPVVSKPIQSFEVSSTITSIKTPKRTFPSFLDLIKEKLLLEQIMGNNESQNGIPSQVSYPKMSQFPTVAPPNDFQKKILKNATSNRKKNRVPKTPTTNVLSKTTTTTTTNILPKNITTPASNDVKTSVTNNCQSRIVDIIDKSNADTIDQGLPVPSTTVNSITKKSSLSTLSIVKLGEFFDDQMNPTSKNQVGSNVDEVFKENSSIKKSIVKPIEPYIPIVPSLSIQQQPTTKRPKLRKQPVMLPDLSFAPDLVRQICLDYSGQNFKPIEENMSVETYHELYHKKSEQIEILEKVLHSNSIEFSSLIYGVQNSVVSDQDRTKSLERIRQMHHCRIEGINEIMKVRATLQEEILFVVDRLLKL